MFTFTALKSLLMVIAAQASFVITMPNDTGISRDLGPVEITRQLDPAEHKAQTAPAKNASYVSYS